MNTFSLFSSRTASGQASRRIGARSFLGLAAALGLASFACLAQASDPDFEKIYEPTPAAQRAPDPAEEAKLRARMERDQQDEMAQAGIASAERERADMQALGFNPDDPIAVHAYRAEIDNQPNVITAAGDFQLNPGWGSGGLAGERYAGSNSGIYLGIKAAMLSTGETVVVGQVQFSSSGARQLGITKRKADGSRATWTGVDPQYSQYSGQYVIYPNTDTSKPRVWLVKDVKVLNDKIYVLTDGLLASPSIYAPVITCFNANGSGCGWWYAYANSANTTNDAVAMDIYADRLVVLGRNSLGRTGGFWTAVWPIDGNGSLGAGTVTNFPAPNGFDRSEPADIAFRRKYITTTVPSYYVLFTKKWSADTSSIDYDPCLFAVNSNNTPDTTFGSGGVLCKPFDEAGGGGYDQAVALTTNAWGSFFDSHEGIQVLVSVARSVHSGIGIWELLDRAEHPRFGAIGGAAGSHARGGGRAVYGGCGPNSAGEGCSSPIFGEGSHTGNDLLNVGADVVVAGFRYGTDFFSSTNHNSTLLARVNGDNGQLYQLPTFGSGYSEGWFYSLVARNDHDIIGVGAAIDSTISPSSARTQIMNGFTNLDDVIFKNGFD